MNNYPLKKLRHIIRKELKIISKKYNEARQTEKPDSSQSWLIDNYYLIEKEGKSVIRDLKGKDFATADEAGLPRCYSALFKLISDGKLPSFDSIGKELADYDLSVAEIELIALMIRAVLVSKAAENVCFVQNIVLSLKRIDDMEFCELFTVLSEAERILESDEMFRISDNETKSFFRHSLAARAKKLKLPESETAKQLKEKAQSCNAGICELFLRNGTKSTKGKWLIALEIILPHIFAVLIGYVTKAYYLSFLLYFPLWEIIKVALIDRLCDDTRVLTIPKVKLKNGLPDNARTVITVSTLLPRPSDVEKVKNHLKELYLTNRDKNINVCLLADLKAADSKTMPEDKINISACEKMINELNLQYGNVFMMYVRERVFQHTQGKYQGFERKRGAIEEFIRYISDGKSDKKAFASITGAVEDIEKTKYILALDSDTKLTFQCVSELVAAASHPLNFPVVDEKTGIVRNGYGIFIPKIETTVSSAYKTAFSKLMAGIGGVSSYSTVCGERQQDLFSRTIFTGKGLIDVNAYYKLLDNRFLPEKILSHDIIEGELLQTAFVCSAQIADSFPSSELSYFLRANRWARGDTQNLPFMFRKVRLNGGKIKNPLSFVSRFRLFDNLRRAYTPIIAFVAILLSVFMPFRFSAIAITVALLGICAEEIYAFMRSLLSGGTKILISQHYGDTVPETLLCFFRIFAKIIMLAQASTCYFTAIIKSLFRMVVTHKNMLEWVTAADSEKMKKPGGMLYKCIPSVLAFVWLLLLGNPYGVAVGVLFLADVPFSTLTSLESKQTKKKLGYLERERVKSYASAMWGYYEAYCNEENNFLPPDNVQQTPVFRVANRTSPTNIGLMLCSVLTARDLSFITSEEMYWYLRRTLETVIKLKKWHGNLLNWYNTNTLEPLNPQYVSTVDSGNFLCSLIALREGVKEYKSEFSPLNEIEKRIDGIISTTDLSAFYNEKRRLFHIGFDLDKNELTDSYYDLLMSESRMISYYAVAKKQVPKKHWEALSRTMSGINGFYGPVSWSGTTFEYFMPYLFVPAYRNTLSFEALKFCVYAQKLRTKKYDIPWGVSESGYYKFDSAMNYQYKAHGVGTLALKKEPADELVISPYSTFLCLPFSQKSAFDNLKKLEDYDVLGDYGFYEALDFTKSRCDTQDYMVVRSFMAHHVGMSMVAVDNALFEMRMQKRFMRDDYMLSCQSILMEKISSASVKIKNREKQPATQKETFKFEEEREYNTISVTNPNVNILSNGEWTTVVSDSGTGFGLFRMRNITRQSRDILLEPLGVFAFVKSKNEIMAAQRGSSPYSKTQFRAEFDKSSVRLSAKDSVFSVKTQITVHPRIACEMRKYTVRNRTKNPIATTFQIYFEPSMDKYRNEQAHKAFSKLLVTGKKDNENKVIVFERRSRNEEENLYCACGFIEPIDFKCNLSREEVLERPEGIFSLNRRRDIAEKDYGNVDVCGYLELSFRLPEKSKRNFNFFICAAGSKDELYTKIAQIRSENEIAKENCAVSPFGIDDTALTVFPKLFYTSEMSRRQIKAIEDNTLDRTVLWQKGISGDNPIIYAETNIDGNLERIKEFITINRKLRYCGIITDLVIAFYETDKKETDRLRNMIDSEFSADLVSAFGGVHLINLETLPISHKNYFIAVAAYIVNKNGDNFLLPSVSFNPAEICVAKVQQSGDNACTQGGYLIAKHPPLPWCYAISNQSFGTLLSDDSLGFSFALNSHENKLTKWNNDTRYGNNGERLFIRIGSKIYDVIRSSSVLFSDEIAVYSATIDGVEFECKVSLPQMGMRKFVEVNMNNLNENKKSIEAVYYCEPVLTADNDNTRLIKAYLHENAVELHNPDSVDYRGTMRLATDADSAFFVLSKKDFFEGNWSSLASEQFYDGCAAIGKRIILPPKRKSGIKFILSYAEYAYASERIATLKLPERCNRNSIEINTGNTEFDSLVNNFLLNQIIDGRLNLRSGFYQCGGAFGFRDQLQDVLSLILLYPEKVKRQLARCAAAQFQEGDVLHWWHNSSEGKKGVRTRYTDDLLWLPYVLSQYVLMTGDSDILNIDIYYLSGEKLNENEDEHFAVYKSSQQKSSMLSHAEKAVDYAYKTGEHSLMLMGGGDWNDGMNKIGIKGEGESVWLTEFMCMVLESMAQMYTVMGQSEKAVDYRQRENELKKSTDEYAYYGGHYVRAFHDDGTVVGDSNSESCKIDSITQSFAVLCDLPDRERKMSALDSAYNNLVDKENGIVKLLTPPFTKADGKVGYIASYPQGIRENGGQYTHAAVWLSLALFRLDRADEGYEVLKILNPMLKYKNEEMAERYKTEPYYLCGDVYSARGNEGRGGWSLYTGAAAWYFTTVISEMLGIKQLGGRLTVEPNLPGEISSYTARIIIDGATINLSVSGKAPFTMTVDGKQQNFVPLDKSDHIVNLR